MKLSPRFWKIAGERLVWGSVFNWLPDYSKNATCDYGEANTRTENVSFRVMRQS
jgi:hypothetical protein